MSDLGQPTQFEILDDVPNGLFVLDEDFKVVFWNKTMEQWTTIPRQEVVGKSIMPIFPHFGSEKYRYRLHEALSHHVPVIFSSQLHKHFIPSYGTGGNSLKTVQTIVTPLKKHIDEKSMLLFTVEDVTDLSNAITEHTKALKQLREEVEVRQKSQEELEKSHEKLKKTLDGTIKAMTHTIEVRDPYTAGHQTRVAQLANRIAEKMALSSDQVVGINVCAAIYDIGKIQVPSDILAKPTNLEPMERELIKMHAETGRDILQDIEIPWPIADAAYQHHERLDGSGYPQGLKGDEICLAARILAVADVVEAMLSHRPYRPALAVGKVLDEIRRGRGKLYDTHVVDACEQLLSEGFAFE